MQAVEVLTVMRESLEMCCQQNPEERRSQHLQTFLTHLHESVNKNSLLLLLSANLILKNCGIHQDSRPSGFNYKISYNLKEKSIRIPAQDEIYQIIPAKIIRFDPAGEPGHFDNISSYGLSFISRYKVPNLSSHVKDDTSLCSLSG